MDHQLEPVSRRVIAPECGRCGARLAYLDGPGWGGWTAVELEGERRERCYVAPSGVGVAHVPAPAEVGPRHDGLAARDAGTSTESI
jgi:hypothetical protein